MKLSLRWIWILRSSAMWCCVDSSIYSKGLEPAAPVFRRQASKFKLCCSYIIKVSRKLILFLRISYIVKFLFYCLHLLLSFSPNIFPTFWNVRYYASTLPLFEMCSYTNWSYRICFPRVRTKNTVKVILCVQRRFLNILCGMLFIRDTISIIQKTFDIVGLKDKISEALNTRSRGTNISYFLCLYVCFLNNFEKSLMQNHRNTYKKYYSWKHNIFNVNFYRLFIMRQHFTHIHRDIFSKG
jgi:hypothetical protein